MLFGIAFHYLIFWADIRILSLSQMEILKYRIIYAAVGSIPNETDILTLSFVIINLVKN